MHFALSRIRHVLVVGIAKLSGLAALIGAFYMCFGIAMLAVVPVEAAKNRDRLDDVKSAIEYKLQHGELPKEYQHDPGKSGINSMWVDGLDECDPDFHPPRSDEFVIGFWQTDWWNCYAYPSGTTTIVTQSADLLRGPPGDLVAEYLLKGLAAIVLAIALRFVSRKARALSLVAMSVWFSAIQFMVGLDLMLRHEVSRQFVSDKEWWTGLAYDASFGSVTLLILRPFELLAKAQPFEFGLILIYSALVFLPLVSWALLFFFGSKLTTSVIERFRKRRATLNSGIDG